MPLACAFTHSMLSPTDHTCIRMFNEIMTKDISEQIKPDWGQIKHSVLNQWEGLMCQSPFEELTHGVGSLSK